MDERTYTAAAVLALLDDAWNDGTERQTLGQFRHGELSGFQSALINVAKRFGVCDEFVNYEPSRRTD